MEYRTCGKTIIARIDKGEEILEQVKEIALKENIKLASIQALGAVNEFTIGVFKTDEKKYVAKDCKGNFEIAGNEKGEVFGGHLNKAMVSATCEMVIYIIDGKIDRYYDEQIGLNLLKF